MFAELKNKFKAWRVKPAQAEIEKLRSERADAVDALKKIATGKGGLGVVVADRALRDIGLQPWVLTELCPPDRIYFLPRDVRVPPTDYF